jgi:hypothetical protein
MDGFVGSCLELHLVLVLRSSLPAQYFANPMVLFCDHGYEEAGPNDGGK